MSKNKIPTLTIERLILRECVLSDAADIYSYSSKGNKTGDMAGWQPHNSIEETIDVINNIFSKGYVWVLVDRVTNKVIGSIGLHSDRLGNNLCELGFVISEDYWGQGLVVEASKEILKYAFEVLSMDEVWCTHFLFNTQSKRVIEKLGFSYRLTSEKPFTRYDGESLYEMRYSLTKEQFNSTRIN